MAHPELTIHIVASHFAFRVRFEHENTLVLNPGTDKEKRFSFQPESIENKKFHAIIGNVLRQDHGSTVKDIDVSNFLNHYRRDLADIKSTTQDNG